MTFRKHLTFLLMALVVLMLAGISLAQGETSEAAIPTARVTLDPGANLHLRQYPSVHAQSLGLAPSGADLIVLGRRGPAEYTGEPVDLSDMKTDPAEGLEQYADLEPADTWLYAAYPTPDGGLITAWVVALHLQVLDATGERQRLASLEKVLQTQPGSAVGTSITSPMSTRRVNVHIYNLNPGVHLNVRIANHASSEILGQVTGGAVLSFLGVDENEEWIFIQYRPSENVIITGWVSAQYAQLQLDGNPIEIQTLKARNPGLAATLDSGTRGNIINAGGQAPPPPTRDPFLGAVAGEVALDPGASLHLRARPNVQALSLHLIPAETRLIVDGITENGEWYRAIYQEAEGWVSGQYLTLSFNNRHIGSEELASELTLFDNSGNQLSE